jgi:uncharacterized protein (TIGR03663 family)
MSASVETVHEQNSIAIPWLTLEAAAYIALAALALGLRLAALGAYPLAEGEALQALAGWGAVQGLAWPEGAYSPLILSLSLPFFLLFGASDFTARLAPALLGSALVPLPYLLRHRLGRAGALVASALLACSPSMLYLSRFAGGGIGVAFGAMLTLVGLIRWLDDKERQWLYLGAGGLAVALASDGNGYLFLILAATFVWGIALLRAEIRAALSAVSSTPGLAGRVVAVFLLTFLAGSTALFCHVSALSRAAELPAEWLAAFTLTGAPTGPSVPPPLFLLVVYEPLVLAFGLVGMGLIAIRRDTLALFLLYWFVGAALVVTLQQGRTAAAMPLVVLPLIILASDFLGRLLPVAGVGLREPRAKDEWLVEGLLVSVLIAIFAYGYIELSWYARTGDTGRVMMTAIALGLCGGVLALFWVWYGMPCALRGGALALALLLAASSFAAGQRLAYDTRTLPYEPLASSPTAPNVRDALETLLRVSNRWEGDAHAIGITVEEATGPVLRWYLRDFVNAQFVADVGPTPTSRALVTTDRSDLGTEEPYAGQDFTLRTFWVSQELNAVDTLRWLLFRQSSQRPQEEKFVLWLRQ